MKNDKKIINELFVWLYKAEPEIQASCIEFFQQFDKNVNTIFPSINQAVVFWDCQIQRLESNLKKIKAKPNKETSKATRLAMELFDFGFFDFNKHFSFGENKVDSFDIKRIKHPDMYKNGKIYFCLEDAYKFKNSVICVKNNLDENSLDHRCYYLSPNEHKVIGINKYSNSIDLIDKENEAGVFIESLVKNDEHYAIFTKTKDAYNLNILKLIYGLNDKKDTLETKPTTPEKDRT